MQEIKRDLEHTIEKLFGIKQEVIVTVAPENTGADYATNVAMVLAKIVHKSPMVIAEAIQAKMEDLSFSRISSSESASAPSSDAKSDSVRSSALPRTSSKNTSSVQLDGGAEYKISVAAPGFMNFVMNDELMIEQAKGFAKDLPSNIKNETYRGKTVVAEFSDPNPFKVLHVGHLYTSIVGDSISRLLEFAGADVIRANFGGDVGLHVAKTLYSVLATRGIADNGQTSASEDAMLTHGMLNTARSASPSSLNSTHSEQSDGGLENSSEIVKASSIVDSEQSSDGLKKSSEIARASSIVGSEQSGDVLRASSEKVGALSEVVEFGCVGEWSEANIDKFVDNLTIEDIAKNYVEGTRAYEEDEAAKAKITELNKEIYRINAEDDHEGILAKLYWRGRELSYEYFNDFYAKIGLEFDKYYPESSVADRGVREVRAHTGTTYEESDGAIVYHGEKVGLHTRVFINAHGVPTYETKDVGLIFTKWDDWHFDESIVVTGNEQSDYMKVVLASVSEYAPQLVERTTHLTHGLVKLPGNVKMSSRKGNFLKAVEVIEMINELVKDENLALAAIKYAFLRYKMGGDIVFDPKESVSTTGNSGVYLLYAAVRAKKILQKHGGEKRKLDASEARKEKVHEKELCKTIVQYRDVIDEAVREKLPSKICTYLYSLAQEFSRFYEHVKVAGNAREDELMEIVQAYYNVMEHGLGLLGIEIPEEM